MDIYALAIGLLIQLYVLEVRYLIFANNAWTQ